MKKKIALTSIISSLCVGMTAFAAISLNSDKIPTKGAEDYYSITINAEDVTTSTTEVSGIYVAHTDQLNNPISFNYEGIKYEQDGENKYLVFGQDAWFGNDKNSQIRKINKFVVYGNNSTFTYNYGWTTKIGSIVYNEQTYTGHANGSEISLSSKQPNYFVLMNLSSGADIKISKIVFTYSKDCAPGEKPAPVLENIALSGQTTSLNRGKTFTFGGTVTAHYDDGSTANVTSQTTFSGYDMTKAGSYTVTAKYIEGSITKTATYKLTVNKAWSTIWSGSKTIGDGGVSSFSFGKVTYVSGLQIRSSFSKMSAWCPTSGDECSSSYVPNGSSPYVVSTFSSTLTTLLQASLSNSSRNTLARASVYYNKNTGEITSSYTAPRTEYARAKITVTKIEAYY